MNEEVVNVRASDMPMIEYDQPLYSSTKDEDRPNIQPVAMQAPEEIDLVVRRAVAEPASVTEFPTVAPVVPNVLVIDKNKLEKTFDKKTSATIVSNLKNDVPLPPSVSSKLVKDRIVKAQPVTEVAPRVATKKVLKKIAPKKTVAKVVPLKTASGTPVVKKEDIFDKITNVIIKTFNIK